MRKQNRVLVLLVILIAVSAFGQSNAGKTPVVFHHSNEFRWDWAGTAVKDIFSPYTVESIHVTRSYARSENERQEIKKMLLGFIRSDSKFAGALSLRYVGRDLEAIVLTKEGKMFIIRRVDHGIYNVISEEKSGYVAFIGDRLKS